MATRKKSKSAEAQGNYCANCHETMLSEGGVNNTRGFRFCSVPCRDSFRRLKSSSWYQENLLGSSQVTDFNQSAEGGDAFKFFGIELETLVNKNFDVRGEPTKYFKATGDGSINGRGVPIEFVSGVLNAKNGGFEKVKKFTEVLSESATVNTSCGFHLHLFIPQGMRNIQSIKKLFFAYQKAEGFFFSLVPESRRHNSYCHTLRGIVGNETILGISSKKQLLRHFYGRGITEKGVKNTSKYSSGADRYNWVNFDSIFRTGTIEIRLHSGTVDHHKIEMWYRIHARFLKWVERHSIKDIKKFEGKTVSELSEYLKDEIFRQGTLQRYIDERQNKFGFVRNSGDDE